MSTLPFNTLLPPPPPLSAEAVAATVAAAAAAAADGDIAIALSLTSPPKLPLDREVFAKFREVFANFSRFLDVFERVWTHSDSFRRVRMRWDAFQCEPCDWRHLDTSRNFWICRIFLDYSVSFRTFLNLCRYFYWYFAIRVVTCSWGTYSEPVLLAD